MSERLWQFVIHLEIFKNIQRRCALLEFSSTVGISLHICLLFENIMVSTRLRFLVRTLLDHNLRLELPPPALRLSRCPFFLRFHRSKLVHCFGLRHRSRYQPQDRTLHHLDHLSIFFVVQALT